MNSKLLIIILVIITIVFGTIAVFFNIDSINSTEENMLDQQDESESRLVIRGLTESVGIFEP